MGAASMLTTKRIFRLADEFSYMGAAASWQGLFRVYHQFPDAAAQLDSQEGLPVTDLLPAFQVVPDPALLQLLESGDITAVRFVTETHRDWDPPVWYFRLELVRADVQAGERVGHRLVVADVHG